MRRESKWAQLLILKNLQQFRILPNRSIRSITGVETRNEHATFDVEGVLELAGGSRGLEPPTADRGPCQPVTANWSRRFKVSGYFRTSRIRAAA